MDLPGIRAWKKIPIPFEELETVPAAFYVLT